MHSSDHLFLAKSDDKSHFHGKKSSPSNGEFHMRVNVFLTHFATKSKLTCIFFMLTNFMLYVVDNSLFAAIFCQNVAKVECIA